MNITFKNVGQGDSILIEWESAGTNKIGIIDCNKIGRSNPVLEYLISKKYNSIEFIVISHPHEDHYSGFKEILHFAEDKKISIGWFGHTITHLGKAYWKWFEMGMEGTRDLEIILQKGRQLKDAGLLKKWNPMVQNVSITVDEKFTLQVLSPSHDEIQEYQKKVKLDADINRKEASTAANLLSTIFKVTYEDKHILLTADSESFTFERILREELLKDTNLLMIQIPHHGSSKNYLDSFWKASNPEKSKKGAIASAGNNHRYRHPHLQVIQDLKAYNYSISCTNVVNGMNEYAEIVRKSMVLDCVSDCTDDDLTSGDKIFSLST